MIPVDDKLAALHQRVDLLGIEGWCKPQERELLYRLARDSPGEGLIVEIGCYKGLSTVYLAAGSKEAGRERVVAIDAHYLDSAAVLRDNVRRAALDDWVQPIVATSLDAGQAWGGEPIRLLFLDGDHRYESVRRDFVTWQRWVSPGGIIAFHDAIEPTWPDVARFLDEHVIDGGWVPLGVGGSIIYAMNPPVAPAAIRSFVTPGAGMVGHLRDQEAILRQQVAHIAHVETSWHEKNARIGQLEQQLAEAHRRIAARDRGVGSRRGTRWQR